MIKMTMSIDGQLVESADDIKNAVYKMAAKGIESAIRKKLSDYSSQMESEGTVIDVDIKSGKILIRNGSQDLKEKITKALS